MTPTVLLGPWSEALEKASNRAVSPEGKRARGFRRFVGHDTPSVAVDHAYMRSVESLVEAAEEASRPNWDGHGGEAVPSGTVAQALGFLELLPSTVSSPEISPHPDGELAFEWFLGPHRMLTVSVNEWGRLSYAAVFGQARVCGTEFLLDAIPEPIAIALRRLHSPE